MNYAHLASFQAIDSCGINDPFRKARQSLQNGLHIHKTKHAVSYVVYEERAHNKSSSRTDLFRKRSTSFSVGLLRTVCGSVCLLSVLVFKISMLIPGDESFGKLALRQSESNPIYSYEGLTLETSVFESFTVANLPYRPCG